MAMTAYTFRMLLVQGYQRADVVSNTHLDMLARWTPFACGCGGGAVGVLSGSAWYLWALGLATLVGAIRTRSVYDWFYQVFLRPIAGWGDMPRHGAPCRFGCAIGAALFLLGGTGFFLGRPLMGYQPLLVIVPLAFVAAFTQWCFASTLYRVILGATDDCC
jgi:hypothetical protein